MSRFRNALVSILLLAPAVATAEVTLPRAISSHMVLQRDTPVPIWGRAAPDEKVTVTFRDQTKTAQADASGNWMVALDPMQVDVPGTMTIEGVNTVTLEDVLVGEVWVGCGQSNMDWNVQSFVKGDKILAATAAESHPTIRVIRGGWAGWREATPENIPEFSALLFAFGVALQKELNVPIGLLYGAYGGTPSGVWLTEEMFEADPACRAAAVRYAGQPYEQAVKEHRKFLEKWEQEAEEAKKNGKESPRKPQPPLLPGKCTEFGNYYHGYIKPFIPYRVRGVLWDQGESGTQVGGVGQYEIMGALIKGWRKEWGLDLPFIHVQKPSGGGCAWDYQHPVPSAANKFENLPSDPPARWSQAFEDHIRLNEYPNMFMAMAGDLGPGQHPADKSNYGSRACRVALGAIYGKKVEYYGPVYESHEVQDGTVVIRFTHVGQGLAFRNGNKLQGFAVAGEDKVYQWADAEIVGDTVVLTCAKVAKPVSVRYAWSDHHPWANLFNRDGLPAIPFRTDK